MKIVVRADDIRSLVGLTVEVTEQTEMGNAISPCTLQLILPECRYTTTFVDPYSSFHVKWEVIKFTFLGIDHCI